MRESVLLWTCEDVFSQTIGFQLLHGSFPAAAFTRYSWAQGKWGKKGTFKIFPRMTEIIYLKTNIRQNSLPWLALLFLGSSQRQKHRSIIHITVCNTLKYCLKYHYQLLPCTSVLDLRKYSCAFWHEAQTLCFLKRDPMSSSASFFKINHPLFVLYFTAPSDMESPAQFLEKIPVIISVREQITFGICRSTMTH